MEFVGYYLEPVCNSENKVMYYQWTMKFEEGAKDG